MSSKKRYSHFRKYSGIPRGKAGSVHGRRERKSADKRDGVLRWAVSENAFDTGWGAYTSPSVRANREVCEIPHQRGHRRRRAARTPTGPRVIPSNGSRA